MKRILSIDGGGIKGVFPAAFLAGIEEATGKSVAGHFDLIAGTSTGGIIALGLGLGISARAVCEFYLTNASRVFGEEVGYASRWVRWMRKIGATRAKYSPDGLSQCLAEAFGDRKLGESKTRLIIPAYHPDQRKVYVFKTAHHIRFEIDFRLRAVEVAMATAAAPIFFPAHEMEQGHFLVDGGVWANNPVGAAVVEAVGVLGWGDEEIRVLSLGCTGEVITMPNDGGWATFAFLAQKLMLAGQSHGSLGTAQLLSKHRHDAQRIFRIDPAVPAEMFRLDGIDKAKRLAGLGYAEARVALPMMRDKFMESPCDVFVPYHSLT